MGRAAHSGARVPHLQRRQGTYHLRVRVPDDLRVRIGLREVRRSLRVHTFAEARPLALTYAARVLEVFQVTRAADLSRQEIVDLIRTCFADLATRVDDGFAPTTPFPDLERERQRALATDHLEQLTEQLETGAFRHPVTTGASVLLKRAKRDESRIAQGRLTDLHAGVARAMIERDRLFLHRLDERLLPYRPTDPLFVTAGEVPLAGVFPRDIQPLRLGPTVAEAVERYLSQGADRWAAKTAKSRMRPLTYLCEHLGGDTPLAAVTSADIVSFRDALTRLRVQSKRTGQGGFIAEQTENEDARISRTTAENLFNPCKAFFAWARGSEGLIADDPAERVRFPPIKKAKARTVRRPFKPDELRQLFSSPVFTGMKSARRRFSPGDVVVKDACYWVPILGFYTGARLGELIQLHLSDVEVEGGTPHLRITEESSSDIALPKSVKSLAGVRSVPLHPDVMELGFADFVRRVSKDKRANNRLFWQVSYGADGQASTVFSKWFRRLTQKAGLADPGLVFHSFRHLAEDTFKNASLPQYVTDRVLGHASGRMSDHYGEGVSLEVAYKAVSSVKFPVSLPDLVR